MPLANMTISISKYTNSDADFFLLLELLTLLISSRQRQVLVTTDSEKLKLKLYTVDGVVLLNLQK